MNEKYSFDKLIRFISLFTFSLSLSFSLYSQECPEINARQYADTQSFGVVGLGSVSNPNQAIDEDLSTYSSINVLAGSVYQNFSWSSGSVAPGTAVSVKMGPEIGLLAIASNITIQPRHAGSDVGDPVWVDGSLLSLLSGENTYEYTFVPASGATPVAYDEIRVTVFAMGLGYTANIYEVYTYHQTDILAQCNEADVVDLLYGVENLGLGVLDVTVGVDNPWNVVDDDPTTYAVMYNEVGLLARAQLTVVFSSPNKSGDLVTVHLSNPGQLLSVGLLNGFNLQLYNGPNAVGPELDLSSSLLSLNLLNAGDEALVEITTVAGMEFDRIKFSLGGIANVLDGMRIHEIARYSDAMVQNAMVGHLFLYPDDPIVLEEIDECTTYQIFDELGNLLDTSDGWSFNLPPGVQEGYTYSFFIQGYRYGCPFGYGKELLVTIYGDTQIPPGECPDINERVYADNQSWFTTGIGTVLNPEQAVDGDPATHSTIVNPIVVAGIGTTVQTLSWNEAIPAGTPVSIKLGPENGLLGLVSGVSVVAMYEGTVVSNPYWIDGNLLSLIGAENTYEYSFVPDFNGTPQIYDAVQIIAGGLLELATAFNVYEAYYHVPVDEIADCGDTEVLDLFYGAQDLGLEVLTATVGVLNPWDAVDGDEDTYALMYNGAAVLAKAELTVVYKAPSKEGDKIQITISEPGTILTVGLLEGFSIQRYYGNMPVGYPLSFQSGLLDLQLLNPGDNYGTIVADPEDALTYDRIQISMGGVANVIDGLRIHEIVRIPPVDVENAEDNILTMCLNDSIVLNPIDDCSYYEIYDEEGNLLVTEDGFIFELPDYVEEGETYLFYIQTYRYGCPFGIETELEVTILPSATQADIGELLVNGTDGSDTLCVLPDEEIILTAALSPDSTITNPVFVWYDENGDWIEENTTGILNLGVLSPGIYTYSVGVYGDDVCESNADERKEITFEIKLSADAGDIEVNDDEICFNETAELIPTAPVVVNPLFKWYITNDYTTPINDGDIIDGVTFGVSVEGILTVTGLEAGSVVTYYVTVSGDNYCENEAGNFAEALVTVFDIDSPTTDDTEQDFCAIDNPTVADIQVNEPGVIWYDAPVGGTPYDPTDPLVDGNTYYGTLFEGDCESTERVAVTVHLIDPGTPTTDDTEQDFCAIDNPTVADIQVNEPGVIWYDAPVGGTPYDPTDPLVDGNTYYGTLFDGDCESTERLAVTVHLIDPGTPTTDDTEQDFCAIDNPTVADIQVNEPGVIWYDAPVGGTPYDPTDPLVDGNTYYGTLFDGDCESTERLAVTVHLIDPGTPTTDDTEQDFCAIDNPTVADIQVNEPGVIWYDAPVGGTPYDPTDPLVDGNTYYGTLFDGDCESTERLAVTVHLIDPGTPTTDDTEQDFCAIDNPTVADIQVNEPGVIWYDAPVGGTPYDPTDPLVDGNTYYGTLFDGDCESTERLAVTVHLIDPGTPTTDDTEQDFCAIDNPTVADIQVNEPGVIWYDAPVGGTPYDPTDPLVDGNTYYGTLFDGDCESTERLAVTVHLYEGTDATIEPDVVDEICLNTVVTYTTESGQSNYMWTVVGGDIIYGGTPADNFVEVLWTSLDETQVSVSYDGVGCYSGEEVTYIEEVAICADISITKEVDNLEPMVGDQIVFTITLHNSGPNHFENVIVSEQIPSGFSYISYQASSGMYSPVSGNWTLDILEAYATETLLITVEVLGSGDYTNIAQIISSFPEDIDEENNIDEVTVTPICLFVYNEFSPNGDGINEVFYITCIETFPDNELKVFNKYGKLVFQTRSYDNTWKGIDNVNSSFGGDTLPSDTYYYVLEARKDGQHYVHKGWLFIIK